MPDREKTEFPLSIDGTWLFSSLGTQLRTMIGLRNPLSAEVINVLDDVDLVPSKVRFSHQEGLLSVSENNEAVIKMISKGKVTQWDMFPEPMYFLPTDLNPLSPGKTVDFGNDFSLSFFFFLSFSF